MARKAEGLQTVNSLARLLGVGSRTAVNYASLLRKAGFLTTAHGGRKVRIYRINPLFRKERGYSFYALLNRYSKVKLRVRQDYFIYAEKEPCVEEILARAVASGEFRVVLASLGLFNKVKNWARLKGFADSYGVGRRIGALYDVAKTCMRVRRMDERTRKGLLNGKKGHIIQGVKSKHFQDIEKVWGVFIPLNKADLEVYKE